jgi:hypothetical protein
LLTGCYELSSPLERGATLTTKPALWEIVPSAATRVMVGSINRAGFEPR